MKVAPRAHQFPSPRGEGAGVMGGAETLRYLIVILRGWRGHHGDDHEKAVAQ